MPGGRYIGSALNAIAASVAAPTPAPKIFP
jgi:hypothetical protein